MIKKEIIISDEGTVFIDGKIEEWYGASNIGVEIREHGVKLTIDIEREEEPTIEEWGD